MGRNPHASAQSAILLAFAQRSTWIQHELAEHINRSPARLRKILLEMQAQGFALTNVSEANLAKWTMDTRVFPQGVVFVHDDAWMLLNVVSTSPKSPEQKRILDAVLSLKAVKQKATGHSISAREKPLEYFGKLVAAAMQKHALTVRYRGAQGQSRLRELSVLTISGVAKQRFLAVSHDDDKVKWFRVDRVESVRPAPAVVFRDRSDAEIARFEDESAFGFHGGGSAQLLVFDVNAERWKTIEENMPSVAHSTEAIPGAVRVTVKSSAPDVWARYLVGYSADVSPVSEPLRASIERIVRAAMARLGIKQATRVASARATEKRRTGSAAKLPPPNTQE
jgi:predicted DNA-binding transcriptional regulator YafY